MSLDVLLSAVADNPYLAIFGMTATGGVLVPIPEDMMLLTCGYVAFKGYTALMLTVPIAMVGILTADSLLYWLGRLLTARVRAGRLPWPLRRLCSPEAMARQMERFRSWGPYMAFGGRFAVGMRGSVFLCAGASGIRYRQFLVLDVAGASLSVTTIVLVGYALGEQFATAGAWVLAHRHLALLAVVLVGLAAFLWSRRRRRASQTSLPKRP